MFSTSKNVKSKFNFNISFSKLNKYVLVNLSLTSGGIKSFKRHSIFRTGIEAVYIGFILSIFNSLIFLLKCSFN